MDALGARLTIAMRERNMRDKDLAEQMFVSVSLIGQWRRGARIPSDKLKLLCQCLNIDAHWLLFGEPVKEGEPNKASQSAKTEAAMK